MNLKLVVALALMLAVIMPTALSAVCPAGYDYYVNKTLTERSGVALPNHAVEFTMDTAALISGGKMNASACGVYIKGVDGTALPSWIVDGTCNKAATRIFTKIPRLTAGGNYKINVCYGDLTPTISTNEIKSIFAAADNFNGGTSINTTYWNKSISGGVPFVTQIINNSYMNFTINSTPYGRVAHTIGATVLAGNNIKNYYMEMKFKPVSASTTLGTRAAGGTSYRVDTGGSGYEVGAFHASSGTNTMTQVVNFTDSNISGVGIGSVWQKVIFKGNYSRMGDNASAEIRNDATNALVSFNRGAMRVFGFDRQIGGGIIISRSGAHSTSLVSAYWDYAFLRNATMSSNGEPNVSYSSGELPSEAPISGIIVVVMNTAGGTSSSLGADFNYTPTTTRTSSTITRCNLTLNGSVVKTDTSITNNTAQNFTYQFIIDDNDKCFSASVECRTNGTSGYMVNQSTPISYCLAIPANTGYVSQFGVAGIAGGAIDTTAGLLAGFASMSENLGAMAALALVILLISGMIGVLLLAIWSKVKKW